MNAPPRLPDRSELDRRIDIAWHEWHFAADPRRAARMKEQHDELVKQREALKVTN